HIGKRHLIKKIGYLIDFLGAYFSQGASINDYFVYKFFLLRPAGRRKYITYKRYHKILSVCNPERPEIEKFRNKILFNKIFGKYLGRKWLDFSKATYQDFLDFINDCQSSTIFVKDIAGYRGIGVRAYQKKQIDPQALFSELKSDSKAQYVIEEKISQTGELADFHPWSINSIRIITVYDSENDKVHIMSANIRTGRNKDVRDNLHSGGIACQIDVESGIVFSPGFNQYNELFLTHPDTGKQFIGFHVPYWEECKVYIAKVAKEMPKVRYVGWDVVSKGDGTFVLIEGNDNADHDLQQLNNKGLWDEYKVILNKI
ncbi:MAG: hypothetical protein K2H76_04870, partial [Muribaculaceae bacterium]|nr:hypothetical protein [Muribaculaceae bacterium]